MVRLEEMRQSRPHLPAEPSRIIFPRGPSWPALAKYLKPPAGEVYHAIEGPKGILGYYIVSDGSTQPYRVRIRPPSFINLQALDKMIRGHLVTDVVAIIGTLRYRPRRGGPLAMSPTLPFHPRLCADVVGRTLCAVLIVLVVPLIAGYIVLVERKVMADMQARLGPMRVGPHGLLQPIADALKLLIKEDLIPDNADQFIFWFAPVLSMTAALTSMGAIAFGPWFQVARDINIGLLFVVGVSALGPFGIVLGGWASNNHYSIIGALRSTAQRRSAPRNYGRLRSRQRIPSSPALSMYAPSWKTSAPTTPGYVFLAPVEASVPI